MIISGLWTHFGYADEFDVPEYSIEREAWLNIVDTLLDEGYHFDLIHAQNSKVIIVKVRNFYHIIHMHV